MRVGSTRPTQGWRFGVVALILAGLELCLPAAPIFPQPIASYYAVPNDSVHTSPAQKARRKLSKGPPAPVVVHDVRVTPYPDHTRVVLDLQRPITFTQHRQKTSNRIAIDLHNVLLSKVAKARLSEGALSQDIVITQSNRAGPQSLTISLNLEIQGLLRQRRIS